MRLAASDAPQWSLQRVLHRIRDINLSNALPVAKKIEVWVCRRDDRMPSCVSVSLAYRLDNDFIVDRDVYVDDLYRYVDLEGDEYKLCASGFAST